MFLYSVATLNIHNITMQKLQLNNAKIKVETIRLLFIIVHPQFKSDKA